MTTPENDKKTLTQATGISCANESLVKKACKTVLLLDDKVLTKRGLDPADMKALAEQILRGPPTKPKTEPVEPELMEPPNTDPNPEPEADPNPGKLTYKDVDAMSKPELKKLAKDCGLPTEGNKAELFNDIVEYLGLVD